MKLGIILVVIGACIILWFATLPVVLILMQLPDGVSVDWGKLGISFAIAFFGGGIPLVWGQEKIKRAKRKI